MEGEQEEIDADADAEMEGSAQVEEVEEETIVISHELTSKFLDADNKVQKIVGSERRQKELIESLKSGEMNPQKYLTFVEVSRILSENEDYMSSDIRKYFTQHLADLALKMSNMGLKQFENIHTSKFVDIKKATGHMSQKQMEYLRVYVVNYLDQLRKSLKDKDVSTNYLDN